MKKINNFSAYEGVLPYASELFGIYQPMLGWKSKRIKDRTKKGFDNDFRKKYPSDKLTGEAEPTYNDNGTIKDISVDIGKKVWGDPEYTDPENPYYDEAPVVMHFIKNALPSNKDDRNPDIWNNLLTEDNIKSILSEGVKPKVMNLYKENAEMVIEEKEALANLNSYTIEKLKYESKAAGWVKKLIDKKAYDKLEDVIFKKNNENSSSPEKNKYDNPLEMFDPNKDISNVSLSPIGIVHLFRQYFFEFDTFLGSPVSHIWLSPGASVELEEVSTRKTITEQTYENTFDITLKNEKTTTIEDEISESIKQSNQSDTSLGMNGSVSHSWIGGSANASASIDLNRTQEKSREITHRRMRQQSTKLSTEIRKNYTSTFRTVSEETDITSKRYVIGNETDTMINYELRRKMRQVGVQVQDVGTYLCWQTFVDTPSDQLGVAELIHLAKSPNIGNKQAPEAIPAPQPITTSRNISIPFIQVSDDGEAEKDDTYGNYSDKHGGSLKEVETETWDNPEYIQAKFPGLTAMCTHTGYKFDSMRVEVNGNAIVLEVINKKTSTGKVTYDLKLKSVNFQGSPSIQITVKVKWIPEDEIIEEITLKNKEKLNEFTERERVEFEAAFVESAQERVNIASHVKQRKFEELREEERIVIYRVLIQDMLSKHISMPDDRTRHVVSELLNTIFDIDKMLYFVAPEWWRPRNHQQHKYASGENVKNYEEHIISWSDSRGNHKDNYVITEDSKPAKLGSSLGWLLQLDGDNMRNVFLNAPWVKAVLPIRPGQEKAAMNWLSQANIEGNDGLDNDYAASQDELDTIPHSGSQPTIRDAIYHLCDKVKEKHEKSYTVGKYPAEEIHDDNRISATPIDKVYEHGFYALKDGFRVQQGEEAFEVFDQWVEVLPTDQVVPVEVEYDPKTGRQI